MEKRLHTICNRDHLNGYTGSLPHLLVDVGWAPTIKILA